MSDVRMDACGAIGAVQRYGAVMAGLAYTGLESTFNAEWLERSNAEQALIALDLLNASQVDHSLTVRIYSDRIGAGNLAGYSACLMASAFCPTCGAGPMHAAECDNLDRCEKCSPQGGADA